MELYLPYVHYALHAWEALAGLSGSRRVTCIVECPPAQADHSLVALLEKQLDRCGPEQLTRAVPAPAPVLPCPSLPVGQLLIAFVVCFLIGLGAGLLLRRPVPVEAAPVQETQAAPQGTSPRRTRLALTADAAATEEAPGASITELRRLGLVL